MNLISSHYEDNLNRIAVLIFFVWVAIMFTTPVGEGDFFWHVKTGEWIWQHRALPHTDPFSFTVKDVNPFNPESTRIPFLLKQYWLGQVFFYGIWTFAGEAGMVIFRSLCYTGILLFLYKWTKQLRNDMVPLLVVVAVGNVLLNYSNERPQIFGFVLMPVLLYLLERIRTSREIKSIRWSLLTLPLVMLFWSNCHGSFILGIVIIALYAASTLIDMILRQEPLKSFSLITMLTAVIAAVANPNGYGAFRDVFSVSKSYTSLVAEYTSPIILAYNFHVFDWFYWILVVVALLVLIFRIKQMKTAHLLVIMALLGLSFSGTRYIPFFVLAAPLLCSYIPKWRPKSNLIFNLMLCLLVGTLIAAADYRNILKFRAERAFPANAVKFLNEIKPSGNMFNYIGWGGYLMCYSSYPVFIDGRTLIEQLLPVHNSVLAGRESQAILDRYGINFMIIPGTDTISLQAYPLLLQLLGSNDWALIYQDDVALILVRNSTANRDIIMKHMLDKSGLSAHIQARWKWQQVNDF